MRDTPERDLAVAEDRLQMADDRIRELEERIRALESACEAAIKAFRKADYGVDIFALAPNLKRAVEQLEGAIKQ